MNTVTIYHPYIFRAGDAITIDGESFVITEVCGATLKIRHRFPWWKRIERRIMAWMGGWDQKFTGRYADRWEW